MILHELSDFYGNNADVSDCKNRFATSQFPKAALLGNRLSVLRMRGSLTDMG